MDRETGSRIRAAAGGDEPTHEAAPLPLARAVLWAPRGSPAVDFPSPEARRAPYPVFLERDVVAAIAGHLARPSDRGRFGFVVGRLYRCPDSGVGFAVAEATLPGRGSLVEEASAAHLPKAWQAVADAPAVADRLLLGWYHEHARHGLLLTDPDHDANRRYFAAPWQFSVVIVPQENRPLGGVFRPAAESAEEPGRPMPFFEIVPRPHGGHVQSAGSAVAWANYEARRPPAPPRIADPALVRPDGRGGGPAGPGLETLRPGVPLVIPGEGAPTGLLPPRSRRVARPVVVAGFLALAAVAWFLFRGGDRPSPVTNRPGPAAPAPARPAEPSPELRQLLDGVDALEIAGERYAERAGDFDAGRIGCSLLTTGYVAADEAYVRVASAYRSLDGDANPEAASAYERAGREIADVNRHFDATGCDRP